MIDGQLFAFYLEDMFGRTFHLQVKVEAFKSFICQEKSKSNRNVFLNVGRRLALEQIFKRQVTLDFLCLILSIPNALLVDPLDGCNSATPILLLLYLRWWGLKKNCQAVLHTAG